MKIAERSPYEWATEQTKECKVCGVEKTLDEYHKLPAGRMGVRPECKTCRNLYKKAYSRGYRQASINK